MKNGIMLIIISILIILFTEIAGISMPIVENYLVLLFAIIAIILFNLRLKKKTNNKKVIILLNVIVLGINIGLCLLIRRLSYAAILSILILCKFLDKIDFSQFNKIFIKNIIKYYIIPLIALLAIDRGYFELANAISETSEKYEFWNKQYVYFAMTAINIVFWANIVMVMLVLLLKDVINSKITIYISSKSITIISSIIVVIILCIKIMIVCYNQKESDNKINILNNAIQSNSLSTYYELNFYPSVTADLDHYDEIFRYMESFNNILIKGMKTEMELVYKVETSGIQDMVKRRPNTKKEGLQVYRDKSEEYIKRLQICKQNLTIQNVANIVIYLLDIIAIFIVYQKFL